MYPNLSKYFLLYFTSPASFTFSISLYNLPFPFIFFFISTVNCFNNILSRKDIIYLASSTNVLNQINKFKLNIIEANYQKTSLEEIFRTITLSNNSELVNTYE